MIVTYRRPEALSRTLHAVLRQTTPLAGVIVVDNGGDTAVLELVRSLDASVDYLAMPDNLGYAAGLAAGMRARCSSGDDYVWLLDDDSVPAGTALERCLGIAVASPRCGIVGLNGGALRHGVPRHDPPRPRPTDGAAALVRPTDFVLVDGALVSCLAISEVGHPRGDFFMMMEDVEFCTRLRAEGWDVLLLDDDLIHRAHLGSTDASGMAPPWRGYYQTRNHLIMALEHRAPDEVWGWATRQAKFVVGALLHGDRKLERVGLRALGAWHGYRRRIGRTIEPSRHS